MDRGKLSKMLGLLKYRAKDGKDETQKVEAANALLVYKSLVDPPSRAHFLSDFESNGAGKGPNALKFVLTFTKKLQNIQGTEIGATENFSTRFQL